jgi:hypothetical protein
MTEKMSWTEPRRLRIRRVFMDIQSLGSDSSKLASAFAVVLWSLA